MPSLRIDGVEIMKANIDVSRGAYFLPGYPLPFDIKQPSPTTIAAQCDKAAIRYDFAPNKMTWSVENRSDVGVPFFIVMDTSVTAVRNDKDEWAKTPAHSGNEIDPKWATTTWFAGRAKLKLTGGSKVWGPWQDKYQVWEASLAPKEKRVITVEVGLTDDAEAAKLGALTGVTPALATDLTLDAPMDYQVFQRKTKFQAAKRPPRPSARWPRQVGSADDREVAPGTGARSVARSHPDGEIAVVRGVGIRAVAGEHSTR